MFFKARCAVITLNVLLLLLLLLQEIVVRELQQETEKSKYEEKKTVFLSSFSRAARPYTMCAAAATAARV